MASQSDIVNGIVIGAAAAAIGTIVAFQFLQRRSQGGGTPNQPALPMYSAPKGSMVVFDKQPFPDGISPLQQTNPNTEAAYNQQPVTYEPAFNTNYPAEEAVLPQ